MGSSLRRASETLETLAAKSSTLPYKIGAVDCRATPREEAFCAEKLAGVMDTQLEHPSFALVVNGDLIPYGDGNDSHERHRRTVPSPKTLHAFSVNNMPSNYIFNVNNARQLEERILSSAYAKRTSSPAIMPAVLLLTDKYETSSTLRALSYYFRGEFVFGESRAKNANLSRSLQVSEYPTLIAFVPLPSGLTKEKYSVNNGNGEWGLIRYDGSPTKNEIIAWLKKVQTAINSERHSKRESSARRKATGQKRRKPTINNERSSNTESGAAGNATRQNRRKATIRTERNSTMESKKAGKMAGQKRREWIWQLLGVMKGWSVYMIKKGTRSIFN